MTSLALLLLLSSVLVCVHADFDKDNIQDDYSLRAGPTSICADRLRLEGDDLKIAPDKVELNGEECTGTGQINLSEDSSSGNSVTAFFLKNKDTVGNFLAGPLVGKLTCRTASIASDTVFVLVRPDDELDDVKWTEFLDEDSGIVQNADDDEWDFEEDRKYVFLADRCFYAQTNLGDRVECFPGDATVTLESGAAKRMDAVQVGDRVQVGAGEFSEVFGWTHKAPAARSGSYVGIDMEDGGRLVATAGHYVYADGKAVRTGMVRAGMEMRKADGGRVRVVGVSRVRGKGLYNPQTLQGDIVVNGVVATTYTHAVEPGMAHALLAPLRAGYKMVRGLLAVGGSEEL